MNNALLDFYASRPEATRLRQGIGQLEALRTRELLLRSLPASPAVVYDVGGATGAYAGTLLEQGYTVHLLDAVPEHVHTAASRLPDLASVAVGDARSLPWPDRSADAVLLMGPLYHLREREDRLRALREAGRVLKRTGVLFAVVIPRWSSALVGALRGWTYDPAYAAMVHEEVTTGAHRRPAGWENLFIDGFFHSRSDVTRELSESGFEMLRWFAIEGAAWMSQDFPLSWEDAERRERILSFARLAESDPDVFGLSPHVAVLARHSSDVTPAHESIRPRSPGPL